MVDGDRYIVVLRGLMNNKNGIIQPSELFKNIRDNATNNNDESYMKRLNYYNTQIFPYLAQNNIDRESLQLTWDFTVMTTDMQTERMINMRDDAFNRIPNDGNVKYRITNIENNPYDEIARTVEGFMTVPMYLNMRIPDPLVRLVIDYNTDPLKPIYQGDAEFAFKMTIPNIVANGTLSARFIEYGHGLFGSYNEITSGYLRTQSDTYGYIIGGVNLIGMSYEDVLSIVDIIGYNTTNFEMIPDRLHQGMLNELFLVKLFKSPNFQNDKNIFEFNGNMVQFNNGYNYYGNSQGGIMGVVHMALTTDVTHGVLGVPGGPYELLLFRSKDFTIFEDMIKIRYPNDIERVLFISLVEILWLRLEPLGYVSHIINNPLPNTPIHNVLFHFSLGDAQVTWLGAEQLGRSLDCYMFNSQISEYNETLYGFNFVNDNFTINTHNPNDNGKCAIQGWNYNAPQGISIYIIY